MTLKYCELDPLLFNASGTYMQQEEEILSERAWIKIMGKHSDSYRVVRSKTKFTILRVVQLSFLFPSVVDSVVARCILIRNFTLMIL